MSMFGAEVAALRSFAQQVEARVRDLRSTLSRLEQRLGELNWTGPDHDRFVEQWQSVHRPRLVSAAADLDGVRDQALLAADRQDDASNS